MYDIYRIMELVFLSLFLVIGPGILLMLFLYDAADAVVCWIKRGGIYSMLRTLCSKTVIKWVCCSCIIYAAIVLTIAHWPGLQSVMRSEPRQTEGFLGCLCILFAFCLAFYMAWQEHKSDKP